VVVAKGSICRYSARISDRFELFGEDVFAHTLAAPNLNPGVQGVELAGLVQIKRPEIMAWLTERRDLKELHENRVETVEWAILIFVIVGVIADCAIVAHEMGWLKPN
jgi:hypothetical protein